jgi:DNA (cytosine-5)-methyltransferase 1
MVTNPKLPSVAPNGHKCIDTLCGGGGMTLAQYLAGFDVIAALNHWALALDSQAVFFPKVKHFRANVRTQHADLLGLADWFHMSPDCRHHSRAKGGKPIDPSVRALAEEAPRYLWASNASVASFENVAEFVDWGPEEEVLDAEGKVVYVRDKDTGELVKQMRRIKSRKGESYQRWVESLRAMGYVNHEYRILNSADYGSPQARKRYFGIFTRAGIPITWPPRTHDEHGRGGLPKWRGAIEILEEGNYGKSVFEGEPYVENTLFRLAAGVERFAEELTPWVLKYVSNPPSGKPNPGYAAWRPLHTLMCQRTPLIVHPLFVAPYYGNATCRLVKYPIPTFTTRDRFQLVNVVYRPVPAFTFAHQFDNKARLASKSLRTLVASRRYPYIAFAQRKPEAIGFMHYYSGGGQLSDLNQPLPPILTNGKARLLQAQRAAGPVSPDKVADQPGDSPGMLALKAACRKAGISDLLVRMLTVRESMRGQGFPDWYTLLGNQSEQRKMIGNAVEVNVGLAVAKEIRKMLDRFKQSGKKLRPLELRAVERWEQGDLFACTQAPSQPAAINQVGESAVPSQLKKALLHECKKLLKQED